MVQYIITPWRSRHELFACRSALYPDSPLAADRSAQKRAVAQVSCWVQRGNCPHLVESTALLVSAVIIDTPETPTYAVRAAYSAAFARFVTGLADSQQEASYKLSMYQVARSINLPASLVELRHQCTHEELPSLMKLRAGSRRALQWIWENYWATLEGEPLEPQSSDATQCRKVLRSYLQWKSSGDATDQKRRDGFAKKIKIFGEDVILETLMDMGDSTDVSFLLQSTKLAAAMVSGDEFRDLSESSAKSGGPQSLEELRAEMERTRAELEAVASDEDEVDEEELEAEDDSTDDENQSTGGGWEVWKGPWISKPIGVV